MFCKMVRACVRTCGVAGTSERSRDNFAVGFEIFHLQEPVLKLGPGCRATKC